MPTSRTELALLRRQYIAHLIDSGCNTLPALMKETSFPYRTIVESIASMPSYQIQVTRVGSRKTGHYQIEHWGYFDKAAISKDIESIKRSLAGTLDN